MFYLRMVKENYQASEKGWLLGHSAASEESPVFVSFLLNTLKHEILRLTASG
jgi:hypothetical protein